MDAQHPVELRNIIKKNVDESSLVWMHRPDKSLIVETRCVDMDCDGLKKVILNDLDGSFLGQSGSVFSQSEWQWNGDRSRGLGDWRIPAEALVDNAGKKKNISDVYTYPGIVRDPDLCALQLDWQAWRCFNTTMKLLSIESLDSDTETRRLSPVAIFSDNKKYVDLLNGPQSKHDFK